MVLTQCIFIYCFHTPKPINISCYRPPTDLGLGGTTSDLPKTSLTYFMCNTFKSDNLEVFLLQQTNLIRGYLFHTK